jgi:hypothetical protein
MSLHSDILFWFRADQSLLQLLNAACLAEKQHIPILVVFGFTRPRSAHDLRNSMRARLPLRLRCGCCVVYVTFNDQVMLMIGFISDWLLTGLTRRNALYCLLVISASYLKCQLNLQVMGLGFKARYLITFPNKGLIVLPFPTPHVVWDYWAKRTVSDWFLGEISVNWNDTELV